MKSNKKMTITTKCELFNHDLNLFAGFFNVSFIFTFKSHVYCLLIIHFVWLGADTSPSALKADFISCRRMKNTKPPSLFQHFHSERT